MVFVEKNGFGVFLLLSSAPRTLAKYRCSLGRPLPYEHTITSQNNQRQRPCLGRKPGNNSGTGPYTFQSARTGPVVNLLGPMNPRVLLSIRSPATFISRRSMSSQCNKPIYFGPFEVTEQVRSILPNSEYHCEPHVCASPPNSIKSSLKFA